MNFIKRLEQIVYSAFHSLEDFLQKIAIPVAIASVNFLKGVLNFDTLDIVGTLADDMGAKGGKDLENRLRVVIPSAIKDLSIAQKYLALGDDNKIIGAVLKEAGTLTTSMRTLFWINLSAMINTGLSNGKMTVQDSMLAVQSAYKNDPEPTSDTILFNSVALPVINTEAAAPVVVAPAEPAIVAPTEPIAPVVPVVPIEPVVPVVPVVPIVPVVPVVPIEPVVPIVPVVPIEPVVLIEPVVPIVPIAPVVPTATATTVENADASAPAFEMHGWDR